MQCVAIAQLDVMQTDIRRHVLTKVVSLRKIAQRTTLLDKIQQNIEYTIDE